MSRSFEWRIRRPYLLLLPLAVGLAIVARPYYPSWKGCPSFSDDDRQLVTKYLSKRFGLADPNMIEVNSGATLHGTCTRRLSVRTGESQQEQTFYLSSDKRYLFRQAEELAHEPQPVITAAASTPSTPIDMVELISGAPPSTGPDRASVTVVEFSDFQCPYCKRMATTLTEQLSPEDKARVRIVFRQFPLPMHTHAREEAELSACVARQSKPAFWKLHDYLFSHQPTAKQTDVIGESLQFLRSQLGIDVTAIGACLNKHETSQQVDEDIRLGKKFGVSGTPTLFINGTREVGALDGAALKLVINQKATNMPKVSTNMAKTKTGS